MTYKYKHDVSRKISDRTARCSVCEDRELPHIHFDPDPISTHMTQEATVRLLFLIAVYENQQIEQFDESFVLLHEKYDSNQPLYVRQSTRFDGSLKRKQNPL